MIRLEDIRDGDEVVILDRAGNAVLGEARHVQGEWTVTAFNTKIIFARDRKNGLGPRLAPGVKVTGHMTQLINEPGA